MTAPREPWIEKAISKILMIGFWLVLGTVALSRLSESSPVELAALGGLALLFVLFNSLEKRIQAVKDDTETVRYRDWNEDVIQRLNELERNAERRQRELEAQLSRMDARLYELTLGATDGRR